MSWEGALLGLFAAAISSRIRSMSGRTFSYSDLFRGSAFGNSQGLLLSSLLLLVHSNRRPVPRCELQCGFPAPARPAAVVLDAHDCRRRRSAPCAPRPVALAINDVKPPFFTITHRSENAARDPAIPPPIMNSGLSPSRQAASISCICFCPRSRLRLVRPSIRLDTDLHNRVYPQFRLSAVLQQPPGVRNRLRDRHPEWSTAPSKSSPRGTGSCSPRNRRWRFPDAPPSKSATPTSAATLRRSAVRVSCRSRAKWDRPQLDNRWISAPCRACQAVVPPVSTPFPASSPRHRGAARAPDAPRRADSNRVSQPLTR